MFSVEDVHYSYDGTHEVLKGVSFDFSAGDILCLLGSNGTGKTTLLRCMLGLSKPRSGHVLINGQDTTKLKNAQRAHLMAYVPQSAKLAFPYRAHEVVMMGRVSHLRRGASPTAKDKQVVADSFDSLRISHLTDRRFQELSGGEQQMVLVARALAQEALLLVMDEPTANLDYHNQVKILAAIKQLASQDFGVLMTSHYPDHAFLACTKVALMKDGVVKGFGKPDDVVTSESLTALYDTPVVVTRADAGKLKIKTCIPILDEASFLQASACSDQPESE